MLFRSRWRDAVELCSVERDGTIRAFTGLGRHRGFVQIHLLRPEHVQRVGSDPEGVEDERLVRLAEGKSGEALNEASNPIRRCSTQIKIQKWR